MNLCFYNSFVIEFVIVKGDAIMKPLISVIVPVYMVEDYLTQCVESIRNQTYQNLEIILVDDGSPDSCGSICDSFARHDQRIKVFHKQNGGLSDARNYGIARATGAYLAFVDSDDWLEPDMYEELVHIAEDTGADIIICGYYDEYQKRRSKIGRIDNSFCNTNELVKKLICMGVNNGVWNKLYRKNCFNDTLFPKGRVFEDISIMYKIFLKVNRVSCITKPLYHYRRERNHAISQTYSMANLIDFWLAHKSRYDYFLQDDRFNTDYIIMEKLKEHCAAAIARTWRWCYSNTAREREQYASFFEEMQDFAASHFSCFGQKGWPLFLRFSIFMARFNNAFAFALLYHLNQGYKKMRRI